VKRSGALDFEDVRKLRRDHAGGEKEILKGISLSVPAGELTVIVGPSGGGKSTLVRLVNRLEDPTSGRILIDGKDIAALDPLQLRRRVGMAAQKPFMFEGSVLENLQRPFLLRGEEPPSPESELLLENLDLCRLTAELLPQNARTLSLGQQQRVSLARTLATRPEILLLDEPTSALDRPTADRLAATLQEVCRKGNLAVLMVTHDLRLAERVAHHLAYLEEGLILEEGSADDLLNRPRTAELRRFLAEPEKEFLKPNP
jgi:putative ABC transport system ATP-binding protein